MEDESIDSFNQLAVPSKLHQQSIASLSTVGSTDSLRKMLEKALTSEEDTRHRDLGLVSPSVKRVQSWSAFESSVPKDIDSIGGSGGDGGDKKYQTKNMKLDSYSVKTLLELEQKAKHDLGPEYGFDITKIHLHYEYRHSLRLKNKVLREGKQTLDFTALFDDHSPDGSIYIYIYPYCRSHRCCGSTKTEFECFT
jgi:hypothetical protein